MSLIPLENKTIVNNDIKQFILRIDFQVTIPINELMSALRADFLRVEERKIVGFEVSVNIPQNTSELHKKDFTDIVFIKDPNVTLTLSPKDNSLVLMSTTYVNNSVYKDICSKIVDVCSRIKDCSARRIGLRYINEIPCPKLSHVSKIFQKRFATVVKNMISSEDTCRAIAVQIRNCDDRSLKIQYGFLNKFFPAILKNYDLLLDIDSATTVATNVSCWENTVKELNHAAYNAFIEMTTEKYIEDKKNA